MWDIIMEGIVKIAVAALIMLIGVLGTWLSQKLATRTELATIREAVEHATSMAQQTAQELQQTTVDGLKAAHADGKLTEGEIAALKSALLVRTREKLGPDVESILTAAGVDIMALITGASESWINEIKRAQ